MLWMHTADGWLRPALKQGSGWDFVRSLGGLAAPSFLLLAGLSMGLGWEGPARPGEQRAGVTRGLQLVVLGYGLRLQMWMLDAGGHRQLAAWCAALVLATGYAAAYRGLSLAAVEDRGYGRLLAAAGILTAGGLVIVSQTIPSRLIPLLRVDVLQAIGFSLVLLAVLRGPLQRRPWLLGLAVAAVITQLTPWFRSWVPGPLPRPLAAYLASWEVPAGQPAPALFPLFPWAAYALVGAPLGLYLGRAQREGPGGGRRAVARLAVAGVLLSLASCEALPHARALLASAPWLTQSLRVIYRVGATMVLGGLALVLSRPRVPLRGALLDLGRTSLLVYWVHLELAFGSLAKPVAHRLGFASWAFGLALLALAMSALAAGWLRVRPRRARRPPARPLPNEPGAGATAFPGTRISID